MASRWLRRSRGRGVAEELDQARAQLTAMFLDMETRQASVEHAVGLAVRLSADRGVESEWAAVRDACYAATDDYLAVDAAFGDENGRGPTRADVDQARARLEGAIRDVDEFDARHRDRLLRAVHSSQAIVDGAGRALTAATAARDRLAGADPAYRGYPSLGRAAQQLDQADASLASAVQSDDLPAVRRATQAVTDAVAAVDGALATAPRQQEEAAKVVSAVRTRLEALTTRAAAMPAAVSEMLREFNAASSADLTQHERHTRDHLERAGRLVDQAVLAKTEKRPEDAVDFATQARGELADAEKYVDAVADRLQLLRGVRADPAEMEKRVRFRLRDAQHLVVARDLVGEWGSVLDAQVARIDRIVAGLSGRHPDYWRYHQELEQVAAFIGTIVERVRRKAVK